MKNTKKQSSARTWALAIGLIVPTMIIIGCATNQNQVGSDVMSEEEIALLPEGAMRGAQLWANNCIRCHNYRAPKSLSDEKWEVVVTHMRVRANLTGGEARQILQFLQAAN